MSISSITNYTHRNKAIVVIVIFVMAFTFVIFMGSKAGADHPNCPNPGNNWFNRNDQCGYFTNGYDSGTGDIIFRNGLMKLRNNRGNLVNTTGNGLEGVNNKDELVGTLQRKLFQGNLRDQRGAAFIVLTTFDIQANNPGSNVGNAQALFGQYENFIRDPSTNIDFNVIANYDGKNTFWQDAGNDKNDKDVAGYTEHGNANSIVIRDGRGGVYKIKKSCGNTIGNPDLSILQKANINIEVGPPGDIGVGSAFTFTSKISTARLKSVGGETFSYNISDHTAESGSRAIKPAGLKVNNSSTVTFNQRGTYSRVTSITGKPVWANADSPKTQTVTVRGWDITASATTSRAFAYRDEPFNVTHTICNSGPKPNHLFVNGDLYGINSNNFTGLDLSVGTPPGGCRTVTYTTSSSTIGLNCSTLWYSPAADNNGAWTPSQACITIRGWDINAYSKVDGATSTDGRSKVIYVGGSATFRHRLYSSGDPLHKAIDGDVVTSNGTATMPGCSSTGGTVNSECWQYRFINVDLAPGNSDRTATRTYTFTEPGTYCENLRFNPGADNDPTPNMFDYNNYSNGTSACVYVIDPKPVVTSLVDYEKNSSTTSEVINFQIKNSSSYCPPAGSGTIPVTLTYAININGTFGGSVSKNYGNGSCDDLSIGVSDVPVDKRATLNNSEPGKLFPYTVNYTQAITTVNANGNIRVVEVPFARFYGNDVYATGGTSGKITFNDTYNNDSGYDGRASVAQYAALASNSIALDTAAYRSIAPLPPSGLDSPNSLLPKTAGKVYDKVVESMPSTCGTLASGVISLDALATNCYVASQPTTTINGSSYANKVTIKGQNVVIGGGITNNSSYTIAAPPVIVPPPPANIATVYQHILFNAPPWNIPGAYAVNLGEGSYTTAQLVARGIPANDISSLKINSSGYRVILFDNNNFTGESRTIVSDANDFTNPGIAWNDRTESIRIEKIVPPPPPTPPSINLISFGVLLIVADNIYISPSVQRIDAILVAKNIIYTCSNGTNPVVNSALDETCRSSLTINGSLSAPTIKYQRVGGSRYLSEAPGSEEQNCATNKAILHCSRSANMPFNTGKTAEIINFPAYLYWANPYLKDESKNGAKVDAIFNAPPRL